MKATCSKCKIEKSLNEFKKDKSKKIGRSSQCKECQKPYMKKYQKKWRLENKEYHKLYSKKYREEHPEKAKESNDRYYQNNKEKHHQNMKEWNKKNPNYMKEWHVKNKEKFKKQRRERWANDPLYRLKGNIRTRIYVSIKNKSDATIKLLGCPIEEYFVYLEQKFDENMTWDNYGKYWEIDHIKPCDSFNLISESEQKKCFHYTNTQPMIVRENRIKSNKHDK